MKMHSQGRRGRKILGVFLLLVLSHGTRAFPQTESHHFITYDTVFNLGYGPNGGYTWLARVTRPARMFSASHPDRAPRPAIIFMGGQGETGKNYANLRLYGPHYWLDHGWDGGISLENGRHYPIIISLQPVSPFPQTQEILNILVKLLHTYHINCRAVHLSGLSQGAFAWTAMICHQNARGDESGMKLATSIVALEGASCNVSAGVERYKLPGWASFGVWARKYHGKFFGLEGVEDYRNVAAVERPMNDSAPGSAYFSYENYGGGKHCCWNAMLDPSVTDWQCVDPITNPNVKKSSSPNAMGSYKKGTDIFQWMLRQGDTTLVNPLQAHSLTGGGTAAYRTKIIADGGNAVPEPVNAGNRLVIRKVAVAEYRTGYLYSDGNFYSLYNGALVKYNYGERKIVDVATGFNLLLALDDQGYVWSTRLGNTVVTRIDNDTTGAAFDKNLAIYGYANTHTSIRSDASLWFWGDDTFHLYHSVGRVNMRPIRLSPPGMKIKKVAMGLHRILVLTTNGQVWEWYGGKGLDPVQKKLPRPAIDIFASQWDYAGCIIPDPGGSRNMGYPYIWGIPFGFWGGNAPSAEPLPLKKLWKMTSPIKEIDANFHTIHYIDSLGRLFGIGDNVMGEIGNGKERVNQFDYPGHYGWTWIRDEYLTGAPPIQVGIGIHWKKLFSDNFLAFYKYATDENDSLYFWGRDKALVSGRGFFNLQEAAHPDVLNLLTPTMVHPLTAKYQAYNFTMPTITAGPDQTISGSTVTLHGAATPPLLIKNTLYAVNGIDTVGYKIVSYTWTKVKGPGAKITDPASPATAVTGLIPGTYLFNLQARDSNTGTLSANVKVTVTPTAAATR